MSRDNVYLKFCERLYGGRTRTNFLQNTKKRLIDKGKERQPIKQAHIETKRQTKRRTDKQTDRQTDRPTNRQTDKQTDQQTDRPTNRQTDN